MQSSHMTIFNLIVDLTWLYYAGLYQTRHGREFLVQHFTITCHLAYKGSQADIFQKHDLLYRP